MMLRFRLLLFPLLCACAPAAQTATVTPAAGLLGDYRINLSGADLPADQQRNAGEWQIGFREDGTHVVHHNGREVIRGTHEVRGNRLIYRQQTGPYACPVPGSHTWQMIDGQLTFTALDDTCAPRVAVMTTRPWSPVSVPTSGARTGTVVPGTAQTADELMNRFAAAWSADDHGAIAGILADDAVYVDAQELVEGRAAVAASWGRSMQATDVMTITPIRSGVEGNTAYRVGRWQLTAGGRAALEGVHTFIFRRGDDGVWRIISAQVEDADS